MTENKNICLIDFDSAIFYSSKDTIENSIENLKSRIDYMLKKTKSDRFILFLTGSRNFRYDLYSEYKANRKTGKPHTLKYLKTLKAYAIEEYLACLIQELEADDVVVYYSNKLKNSKVCSPDKDVLNQNLGSNFNYGRDEWVDVTRESADRFLAWQLLCGDAGDNIPGVKERTKYMKERFGLDNRAGVGAATADKILDIIDEKYSSNYASEILACYNSKYTKTDYPNYTGTEGFEDYTMNRHLLQLNPEIGRYNKILTNYDIDQHINTVQKEIINETDEF
jgi:5'-3' exonuclease